MNQARMCSTMGHENRVGTNRATWTVYGGGLRSRVLCDDCTKRVRGQRGVQLTPVCPHGRPCAADRLCACSTIKEVAA